MAIHRSARQTQTGCARLATVKRRGFALIYQLMISLIVFMLLGALLTLSRTQIFNAHSEIAGLRAQYAAESGLASVMAEITRNVSWRDGFARAALPGGTETYSVQFTAGTPGPDDSVNNLQQNTPADSYLGPATVPPHSAFIVVRGESAGSVRTLEAYLVGAGNPPRGTALAAVSTISLLGNGTIDAYNSMRSLGYIPVNVHSNSEAGPRAFSYKALRSGDRLEVQGRIGTVSDAPDAIHFEGPHTVGSQAPGAAYSKFPEMNVSAIVATHSVSPGTPLPNVGGVTLGAGAGDAGNAMAGTAGAGAEYIKPEPPFLTILTFSSPSVTSSSEIPDSCTRSISFLSLRKSMACSPCCAAGALRAGMRY